MSTAYASRAQILADDSISLGRRLAELEKWDRNPLAPSRPEPNAEQRAALKDLGVRLAAARSELLSLCERERKSREALPRLQEEAKNIQAGIEPDASDGQMLEIVLLHCRVDVARNSIAAAQARRGFLDQECFALLRRADDLMNAIFGSGTTRSFMHGGPLDARLADAASHIERVLAGGKE
jgi:hypothetical protein